MPSAILILTFLVCLTGLTGFFIGDRGNRKMKEQLTKFYIVIEEGDWTYLYRYPASLVLGLMTRVLGRSPLTLKFILRSAMYSTAMTILFFFTFMIWSYVSSISQSGCPVPGIHRFVQIPLYMSDFLIYIILINAVFDYVSWSATRWGSKILAFERGSRPLMVVLAFPAVAVAIIWLLYGIYLPLSIEIELSHLGVRLGWEGYAQILRTNFKGNILLLFGLPDRLFGIVCNKGSPSTFSISFISTMRVVAIETAIPALLLLISSAAGVLTYATRSFTRRPISLLLERLDSSQKSIFALMAGALSAILALLIALANYRKS